MLTFKSEYFKEYYGEHPNEYDIKFIHNHIEIIKETKEEYKFIEEDLKTIKDYIGNSFLVFFSEYKDLVSILNNTSIINDYKDVIFYKIRTNEEYIKYKKLNIDINLVIEKKDLMNIDIKDDNVTLQINTVSEFTLDDLYKCNLNISKVSVGQIAYTWKDNINYLNMLEDYYKIEKNNQVELEKRFKLTNDIYDIDTYKKILNELNRIIEINKKDKLIDTMESIFVYLARLIQYDSSSVEHTNVESQNLIGPLFKHLSVCEGYSKTLMQIYSLLNIESIIISGGGEKNEGGHIWNQVKYNGKWYNCDLTYQSTSFRESLGFNMFLIKDDKCLYPSKSIFSHECSEDYKGE